MSASSASRRRLSASVGHKPEVGEHVICTVILTLNEEANIGRSIASAQRVGDVLVLDSGSTDGTAAVVEAWGARFLTREWRGFASQRNAALELCATYEWVVFLDADETFDNSLVEELQQLCTQVSSNAGLMMRRINFFLGRRLKRAGRYPDWQLRAMRPGASRFEDVEIHERAIVEGSVGRLRGHLLHRSDDNIADFLAKHSAYARLEARSIAARGASTPGDAPGRHSSRLRVRRFVKERIWLRLPARGAARMFWLMIIKGGLLDGREGWAYAKMLAAYECMIDVYLAEERLAQTAET